MVMLRALRDAAILWWRSRSLKIVTLITALAVYGLFARYQFGWLIWNILQSNFPATLAESWGLPAGCGAGFLIALTLVAQVGPRRRTLFSFMREVGIVCLRGVWAPAIAYALKVLPNALWTYWRGKPFFPYWQEIWSQPGGTSASFNALFFLASGLFLLCIACSDLFRWWVSTWAFAAAAENDKQSARGFIEYFKAMWWCIPLLVLSLWAGEYLLRWPLNLADKALQYSSYYSYLGLSRVWKVLSLLLDVVLFQFFYMAHQLLYQRLVKKQASA
jgi:hypothetical protein